MKKQLILFAALLFSVAVLAQSGQRYGRGFLNEKNMKSINSDNIEFTISKSEENINVTTKLSPRIGFAWDLKGSNKLNGKIMFVNGAEEAFVPGGSGISLTITGVKGVKVVLANDPGGKPVRSTTLNADGSFNFAGVPKGTYQLSLEGKVIATGWKIGEQ